MPSSYLYRIRSLFVTVPCKLLFARDAHFFVLQQCCGSSLQQPEPEGAPPPPTEQPEPLPAPEPTEDQMEADGATSWTVAVSKWHYGPICQLASRSPSRHAL